MSENEKSKEEQLELTGVDLVVDEEASSVEDTQAEDTQAEDEQPDVEVYALNANKIQTIDDVRDVLDAVGVNFFVFDGDDSSIRKIKHMVRKIETGEEEQETVE